MIQHGFCIPNLLNKYIFCHNFVFSFCPAGLLHVFTFFTFTLIRCTGKRIGSHKIISGFCNLKNTRFYNVIANIYTLKNGQPFLYLYAPADNGDGPVCALLKYTNGKFRSYVSPVLLNFVLHNILEHKNHIWMKMDFMLYFYFQIERIAIVFLFIL